jgi:hypothetical protein
MNKNKLTFYTILFLIVSSSFPVSAEETEGNKLFGIVEEFIDEFKFADDGGIDLFGIHFLTNDNGLDMTYMIPMNTEHHNIPDGSSDVGRITVSLSNTGNENWYEIDCSIGFYYDLTDYLYTGIETAWNIIDSSLRFSVQPMANFKIGECVLLKGRYELGNLGAGITQSLYLEFLYSKSF